MVRRRDEDERGPAGDGAVARVEDELRAARNEVFRAYVRAREQARGLAEAADRGAPPHDPDR